MHAQRHRQGYVFLVTVLIIGIVAVLIVSSLLFIATNAARTGLTLETSGRALNFASTCMESALLSLHTDGAYAGNETQTFTYGSCRVLAVGGSGNGQRTICTEGLSGSTTRRLEVTISRIIPSIRVVSWQEVPSFTLCTGS